MDYSTIQSKILENSMKIEGLEWELSSIQWDIERIKNDISVENWYIEQVQLKISKTNESLRKIVQNISQKNQEISTTNNKITATAKQIAKSTGKTKTRLLNEKKVLESNLTLLKSQLSKLSTQKKNLDQDLKNQNRDRDFYTERVSSRENEKRDLEGQIKNIEDTISRLKADLSNYENQLLTACPTMQIWDNESNGCIDKIDDAVKLARLNLDSIAWTEEELTSFFQGIHPGDTEKPSLSVTSEIFGNYDPVNNINPNDYELIIDSPEDKSMFWKQISDALLAIENKQIGFIELIFWPDNKIQEHEKNDFPIILSQDGQRFRLKEVMSSPYFQPNTPPEQMIAFIQINLFKKNKALAHAATVGTCGMQSVAKITMSCIGSWTTIGDGFNPDFLNKIAKKWYGWDKPTNRQKIEGMDLSELWWFSPEEQLLALQELWMQNCKMLQPTSEMCNANKNKSCILNVGNAHLLQEDWTMKGGIPVSAHIMPINSMQSAKNGGGCYFNTDNTFLQGDHGYPVNPGRQIWWPGGIEQDMTKDTSLPWLSASKKLQMKPTVVICCDPCGS